MTTDFSYSRLKVLAQFCGAMTGRPGVPEAQRQWWATVGLELFAELDQRDGREPDPVPPFDGDTLLDADVRALYLTCREFERWSADRGDRPEALWWSTLRGRLQIDKLRREGGLKELEGMFSA